MAIRRALIDRQCPHILEEGGVHDELGIGQRPANGPSCPCTIGSKCSSCRLGRRETVQPGTSTQVVICSVTGGCHPSMSCFRLFLAANALGFGFAFQRRQEHAGQDRDDGDDHQQFNQGESVRGGQWSGDFGFRHGNEIGSFVSAMHVCCVTVPQHSPGWL